MSWDVLFVRDPSGVDDVGAAGPQPGRVVKRWVGQVWRRARAAVLGPEPLGQRDEIIAVLRERLPGIDFSDPSWGGFRGPNFSIEFNLGKEPVATSLMLHVRGGDGALGVVRAVSEALACPAIDTTLGNAIDFGGPRASAGFAEWRRARDQVRQDVERPAPPSSGS